MANEDQVIVQTRYGCPVCGHWYATEAEAEDCLARTPGGEPAFRPGDIAIVRYKMGWYEGPDLWRGPRKNGYVPVYFVCTKIGHARGAPHERRYHFHSAGYKDSKSPGYGEGFATEPHGSLPAKVEDPHPDLVDDSKRFIGMEAHGPL